MTLLYNVFLFFMVLLPFEMASMQLIKSDAKKNKNIWFKSDQAESIAISFKKENVAYIPAFKDLFIYQGYQKKRQKITGRKKIKRVNSQQNPLIVQGCTDVQLHLLAQALRVVQAVSTPQKDFKTSFFYHCRKQFYANQCCDLFNITSKTGCIELSRLLLPLCIPIDIIKSLFLIESFDKHRSVSFSPKLGYIEASTINSDGSQCAMITKDNCWLCDLKDNAQPVYSPLDMKNFQSFYSDNYVYLSRIGMAFNNDASALLIGTERGGYGWNIAENKELSSKTMALCGEIFPSNTIPNLFASFDDGQRLHINILKNTLCTAYLHFNVDECPSFGLQWSPDDKYIVVYGNQKPSAAQDTYVCIVRCPSPGDIDEASPIQDHKFFHYAEQIFSIAWSPDSSFFACLSRENLIFLDLKGNKKWGIDIVSLPIDEEIYVPECLSFSPGNIAFSKDGNYCFVEQVDNNRILVVKIDTHEISAFVLERAEKQKSHKLIDNFPPRILTSFTPDGLRLIVLREYLDSNELVLYDSLTGKLLDSLIIDKVKDGYDSLQVSSEGTMIFLSHEKGIDYYSLYLSEEKHFGIRKEKK